MSTNIQSIQNFIFSPTVPTLAVGTNTLQSASTAFVTSAILPQLLTGYVLPTSSPGVLATTNNVLSAFQSLQYQINGLAAPTFQTVTTASAGSTTANASTTNAITIGGILTASSTASFNGLATFNNGISSRSVSVYGGGAISVAAGGSVTSPYMALTPSSVPTGANGLFYYDSTSNLFQFYQNGAYVNLNKIPTLDQVLTSGAVSTQAASVGPLTATNTNLTGTLTVTGVSTINNALTVNGALISNTPLTIGSATSDTNFFIYANGTPTTTTRSSIQSYITGDPTSSYSGGQPGFGMAVYSASYSTNMKNKGQFGSTANNGMSITVFTNSGAGVVPTSFAKISFGINALSPSQFSEFAKFSSNTGNLMLFAPSAMGTDNATTDSGDRLQVYGTSYCSGAGTFAGQVVGNSFAIPLCGSISNSSANLQFSLFASAKSFQFFNSGGTSVVNIDSTGLGTFAGGISSTGSVTVTGGQPTLYLIASGVNVASYFTTAGNINAYADLHIASGKFFWRDLNGSTLGTLDSNGNATFVASTASAQLLIQSGGTNSLQIGNNASVAVFNNLLTGYGFKFGNAAGGTLMTIDNAGNTAIAQLTCTGIVISPSIASITNNGGNLSTQLYTAAKQFTWINSAGTSITSIDSSGNSIFTGEVQSTGTRGQTVLVTPGSTATTYNCTKNDEIIIVNGTGTATTTIILTDAALSGKRFTVLRATGFTGTITVKDPYSNQLETSGGGYATTVNIAAAGSVGSRMTWIGRSGIGYILISAL